MTRFHASGLEHSITNSSDVIDFSTNLNPLGTPDVIHSYLLNHMKLRKYVMYPDHACTRLKQAIAMLHDISSELIEPTNGSSEALNLVMVASGLRCVVTLSPTYGEGDIEEVAEALGMEYVPINAYAEVGDEWLINIENVVESRLRECLIVLSNPNNPLGTYVSEAELREIALWGLRKNNMIVIDASYTTLSGLKMPDVHEHINLVIIKSLTKDLAIPGIRAGFIYTTNKRLLNKARKLRPTWSVNSLASIALADAIIENAEMIKAFVNKAAHLIREWRENLINGLRSVGTRPYISKANFVLARTHADALELRDELFKKRGILIRPAHTFIGLGRNYFRVSVKPPSQTRALIEALKDALK